MFGFGRRQGEPPASQGGARRRAVLLGGTLLALSLSAQAAAAALPQEAETVEVPRLRFEFHCFFKVQGWQGRAEENFLDRLRDQHAAYVKGGKPVDDLEALYAEALGLRAEALAKDPATRDAARQRLVAIGALTSSSPAVASAKRAAGDRLAELNLDEAQALLANQDYSERTQKLLEGCLGASQPKVVKVAAEGIVKVLFAGAGLDGERGAKMGPGPRATALSKVIGQARQAFEGRNPVAMEALGAAQAELLKLENSITVVAVARVDFAATHTGRVHAVDGKARLQFVPKGGEAQPWPPGGGTDPIPAAADGLVVLRGVYDILVTVPGDPEPVCVWRSAQLTEKTFRLPIPQNAPVGMVYVGPWKAGSGEHGGFFIDRTEVPVAQVTALADRPALAKLAADQEKNPDMPAYFPVAKASAADDEKAVGEFAAAMGKAVPTAAQWLDAAYGPGAAAEWPWGSAAPVDGTHAVVGRDPVVVGGRAAGASPYGVQDMIGNVAEWVTVPGKAGYWLLGGGGVDKLAAIVGVPGKSLRRDPKPGPSAYSQLPPADQNVTYKDYNEGDESDFYETGLRLVVPVNR